MKKILSFIFLSLLLLPSCQKEDIPKTGDLITGNTIYLDGEEGAETTFRITASYDWQIICPNGVSCNPASGAAGTDILITAKALQSNTTLHTLTLGDLAFKLKSVKFVGVTIYQNPLIQIGNSDTKIMAEAAAGSVATLAFTSKSDDIEVECNNGMTCQIRTDDPARGKYTLVVTTDDNNFSMDEVKSGEVYFKVGGKRLNEYIEIFRHPAIRLDKNIVFLAQNIGSENRIEVISPFEFNVAGSNDKFTTMAVGNTIFVTAQYQNDTANDVVLGTLQVALAENTECKAVIDVVQHKNSTPQTILFYFLGTHLNRYFNTNIEDTIRALDKNIAGDSRVLICITEATDSKKAILYEARYDSQIGKCIKEKVNEFSLPSQYDAQMFASILNSAFNYAPAEHYGLIIGSHGKGWIPKNTSRALMSNPHRAEWLERIWTPAPGALITRHIGDSAATQLNTTELAEAIASTGKKLQYIIFDACFMGNVESAYDLRSVTDYIVGSTCEIMGDGMPYERIMPHLLLDNGRSFDLDKVSNTFVQYYKTELSGTRSSACSAVIDCAQLESLAESVKRVNMAQQKSCDLNAVQSYDGVRPTDNPTHIFYDLEDYIEQSCNDAETVDGFVNQLNATITSRYHTDQFYSAYNQRLNDIHHFCGITTSAPITLDPASAYIDEWKRTAWYKATH